MAREPGMSKQIINLAGCIILDERKRVLLVHRNTPKRVQWEIPGGKQDEGELLEDVARRELFEELGVDVRIDRKLGQQMFQEDSYTMSYTWYLGEVIGGTARIVETETHDGLRYFSIVEMNEIRSQLSPNT